MTHGSLFTGIGGFDLAAQWMGWQNLFHCEWNPFCQAVLKHHWPDATTYTDICATDFTPWRGRIDVFTGGFPCQPFSTAGKRKGTADDRYLWPQMLRAIREIAPRHIVGENVSGIYTWNDGLVFETVCADLENEGYEVVPLRIPACATGAPHRRDRWWFVAHTHPARPPQPQGQQPQSRGRAGDGAENAPNPPSQRLPQPRQTRIGELPAENEGGLHHRPELSSGHAPNHRPINGQNGLHGQQPTGQAGEHRDSPTGSDRWQEPWPQAAARLCRLDDGLPRRLDADALSLGRRIRGKTTTRERFAYGKWRKESLKAYGNAIVPQIAYQIFKAIEHAQETLQTHP